MPVIPALTGWGRRSRPATRMGERDGRKGKKEERGEERGEGKWDINLMLCERGLDFCLGSEVNWKYCFSLKEGWFSKFENFQIWKMDQIYLAVFCPSPGPPRVDTDTEFDIETSAWYCISKLIQKLKECQHLTLLTRWMGTAMGESSQCALLFPLALLGDLQSKGLRITQEGLTKTWSPWACWEWQSQL